MTETPGPQDPHRNDIPTSPQPGRPPYAGLEWRRADAPTFPPRSTPQPTPAAPAGPAQPQAAQASPAGARPGPAAQVGPQGAPLPYAASAPQSGSAPYARPAPPSSSSQYAGSLADGQRGTGSYGASSPANGSPGPSPPPVATRRRGGRRLVAVAAVTAVLGGLVGGGAVAVLDPGGSTATVSAAGISVSGGSAPAAASTTGSVEAAAATASKSVVTLTVAGSSESGTGSGVIVRVDGYILTNEHVVAVAASGGTITVSFGDGRTATATLVGSDKATDLAVVKVSGVSGLTAATFADSDAVKLGQTVVAVGSPLGLDGTVTEGIVSALHRTTTGASDDSAVIDALQTDAAINPGNSGGALVDLAGRVVGINQSIATASSGSGGYGQQSSSSGNIGIGFAIPADTAARIAQELITGGTATHAYLGVQTQSAATSATATATGATVASVESGGPAAAAGLAAGDVVTKVDGRVIGESTDLVAAIRSYAPGTEVTLTVQRSGATRTVAVTLGSDAKQ